MVWICLELKFQNDNAEIQEEIQVVLESKGTQTVQFQPFQEVVKRVGIWKSKKHNTQGFGHYDNTFSRLRS